MRYYFFHLSTSPSWTYSTNLRHCIGSQHVTKIKWEQEKKIYSSLLRLFSHGARVAGTSSGRIVFRSSLFSDLSFLRLNEFLRIWQSSRMRQITCYTHFPHGYAYSNVQFCGRHLPRSVIKCAFGQPSYVCESFWYVSFISPPAH